MNLKISEIPVLPGMLECQSMQERQQVHSQVPLGSQCIRLSRPPALGPSPNAPPLFKKFGHHVEGKYFARHVCEPAGHHLQGLARLQVPAPSTTAPLSSGLRRHRGPGGTHACRA